MSDAPPIEFVNDEHVRASIVEAYKVVFANKDVAHGAITNEKQALIAELIGQTAPYKYVSNFEKGQAGASAYKTAFHALLRDYPEVTQIIIDGIERSRSAENTQPAQGAGTGYAFSGPKTDAIRAVHSLRSDIVELRNTHIVSSDQVYYDDEENQLFREIFTAVLDENSGSLLDVFGGEKGSAALNDHYATAAQLEGRPRYFKKVVPLKPPMLPFLNFMLIRLRDQPRIVFYGWGGVGNDSVGDVVGTDDPGATAIFHNIHVNLFTMAANSK